MTHETATFAGLREKLRHETLHGICSDGCAACYFDRLKKAVEELRDELKGYNPHWSTPISETEQRISKRLTALLGSREEKR